MPCSRWARTHVPTLINHKNVAISLDYTRVTIYTSDGLHESNNDVDAS